MFDFPFSQAILQWLGAEEGHTTKAVTFPAGIVWEKVIKNFGVWSCCVTEADRLDFDDTRNFTGLLARLTERVDVWGPVDQSKKLCSTSTSANKRGNIWSNTIDPSGTDDGRGEDTVANHSQLFVKKRYVDPIWRTLTWRQRRCPLPPHEQSFWCRARTPNPYLRRWQSTTRQT